MSHFTRLDKANIVDTGAFVKACKELGLTEVTHGGRIADFSGKEIEVDVSCRAPGGRYSIGLKRNAAGTYDALADYWGLRVSRGESKLSGMDTDEEVQNAVLRLTTKHTIVDRYARQGFRANVVEDGEKIRLTLTKY